MNPAKIKSPMTPDELRDEIKQLGYTQIEMAEIMGVDPRTMRRWVLGERPIPQYVANFLDYIPSKETEDSYKATF